MPSERDLNVFVLFRGASVSRKPDGDPGEGAHARPSQPDPLATEADQGGEGEKLVRHQPIEATFGQGAMVFLL